ncbi:MAG: hypothetical protein QXP36_03960 [Conexivisphaerales archaeon]
MIEGIEEDLTDAKQDPSLIYASLMLPYKFKVDYEWVYKGIYLYEKKRIKLSKGVDSKYRLIF